MKPLVLPDLGYHFNALEPFISAEIMEIHYTKHHQAYVTNFNVALEKTLDAQSKGDLSTVLSLQQALKFNGGGHINHSIFWTNLVAHSHGGGHLAQGPLHTKIIQDFGSLEQLKEKMSAMALALQGSGWVWLGYDKGMKRLVLASCSNQDPVALMGYVPLLGIDVWEHAYYLQYRNVRAEYIKNIWNIINFKNVEDRFLAASM
jgi:superoxide dismutase, Fe-Mn family